MGSEDGYVGRTIVIDVLQRNGVQISRQEEGLDGMLVLVKGEVVDTRRIPDEVSRRVLQYFQRRFSVPIHHFYNPLMAPRLPGEKIQ